MPSAKLLNLVILCFIWEAGVAHATETATDTTITGLQNADQDSHHANRKVNVSQPVQHTLGLDGMNAGPDCEGQSPSAGSVTALMSRLVRSSTVGRDVQCPSPSEEGQSTEQEIRR
jgi:hypothetical protein